MQTIKKISSVFLAILFLVSSLGFTINKMVCLKSGKTKISLTNLKDCCKKDKSQTHHLKGKCCDISNTSFSLSAYNSIKKNNVPDVTNFIVAINRTNSVCEITNSTSSKLFFADLPPPLYGRALLSFISVLVI